MSHVPYQLGNIDRLLGVEVDQVSADRVTGRLEIDERHHQPYGMVNGGVLSTMVETLASVGGATWAVAQGMTGAVGVNNNTDFVRPVRRGILDAEALPIHRGRTQQLWEVRISTDGKLVARGQVRLHNITDPALIGG